MPLAAAGLQEEALHRWVEGLGAVERAIREPFRPAPAPRAHLALLHRQVIGAVLRRLDTLLFRCMRVAVWVGCVDGWG